MKTGVPLIVYGEDGVGKSQMANRAAKELGLDVKQIIASNVILMQRDLRENLQVSVGREKGIEGLDCRDIPILDRYDAAVIFDNIVDLSLLEQIAGLKCKARIIATTVLKPPVWMEGFNSVELKRWGVESVRKFLGKDCGLRRGKGEDKNIYLPFALELASVYIQETGRGWSYVWENSGKAEVEYYAAELYMQLEKVKQFKTGFVCEALQLLKFSSLLCGESIRVEILVRLCEFDPRRTQEGLHCLERMRLIRLREDEVYICPKVQTAVRSKMVRAEILSCINVILCNAELMLEKIDIEPWKLRKGKDWRAHIEHILTGDHAETDSSDEVVWIRLRFFMLAGKYDFSSGEYISARGFFQQVKESARQSKFDRLRRDAMIGMARVLEVEKDNEGVRNEIAQIGEEWPRLAEEDPALQVDILIIASQAEENLGSYRQAEALLKQGLKLLDGNASLPQALSEEKKVYLFNGLGKIYYVRHWYMKAMNSYNNALSFCETTSGFKEAFVKHNKGYIWYRIGRFRNAEECFLGAMEIYQSVCLGEPTSDELDNLNALINLYTKMKGKEKALEQIWELEQQRMMEGGQQYRNAELFLYNNYSIYQYKKGNFEDALSILDRGIKICEQENNVNLNGIWIFLLANRAETLAKLGHPVAALENFDLAIKKSRGHGGSYLWIYWRRFLLWFKNTLLYRN